MTKLSTSSFSSGCAGKLTCSSGAGWWISLLLLAGISGNLAAQQPGAPAQAESWKPLFNGKDLDGWMAKITGYKLGDNFGHTFRAEDGVLQVRYDGYDQFDGRFGHLIYHQPFSHYRLRLEYRFIGDQVPGGPTWALRNSGIMLHGQAPDSMHQDQDFPVSIEVQLLGDNGTDRRPTANLCTPGTHVEIDGQLVTRHCTDSTSQTYHGDQWVAVEVEVRGNQVVKHMVDGQLVLRYEKPQLDPGDAEAKKLIDSENLLLDSGYISLQSESHPVDFRKIEILDLGGKDQD